MTSVVGKHVFFLGIGGIGMSALARHLKFNGHVVGGYDLTPSDLLNQLVTEGIDVIHSDHPTSLPHWATGANSDDLTVVWTPAVPKDLPLFQHFVSNGIHPIKRAALLGQITHNQPTLAVAGTHGKTTTSSWLAAMLSSSGQGCHAFLGGVNASSGSNYITTAGATWHVVEADEFDRSFHHLHPTHAAITNIEPDHMDIYEHAEAFRDAFEQFGQQVKDTLLLPASLSWPNSAANSLEMPQIERFAVCIEGEEVPEDVHHLAILSNSTRDVQFILGRHSKNTALSETNFVAQPALSGAHNVANALVASALTWHTGIQGPELAQTVQNFGGVKRRMEVHIDQPNGVYLDDYAHHPTELQVLLEAVRSRWPNREITLVFQPHLYSRTRDFATEFAEVLAQADRLFLLPIYPARETPIPGVDAQWLFDNISSTHKHLTTSDSIFGDLKACPLDVLVTAGAGDIDRLIPQAVQHMKARLE